MAQREHQLSRHSLVFCLFDLQAGESELNGNYSLTCPRCNHSGGSAGTEIASITVGSVRNPLEILVVFLIPDCH